MKTKNILIFSETSKTSSFEGQGYKLPIDCGGSQKSLVTNLDILKRHFNVYLLIRNLKKNPVENEKDITIIPGGSLFNSKVMSYFLIFKELLRNKPFNIKELNKCETIVFVHNDILLSLATKLLKPRFKVFFLIENDYSRLIWKPYGNIFLKFWFLFLLFPNILLADKVIRIKNKPWFPEQYFRTIKHKSFYIPNGINKEIFKPSVNGKKPFAQLNEINENDIILLYIGRLLDIVNKNPGLLFHSFEIVNKEIHDLKLVIIGVKEDDGYKLLKKFKIKDQGKIIFAGIKSNDLTVPYYQSSNLTLLTSNYEGNPYVLLESLACGTPCVSTDVINDDVINDGVNGFISKSKKPEDFAKLILKGLNLSYKLKPLRKDLLNPAYELKHREKLLLKVIG